MSRANSSASRSARSQQQLPGGAERAQREAGVPPDAPAGRAAARRGGGADGQWPSRPSATAAAALTSGAGSSSAPGPRSRAPHRPAPPSSRAAHARTPGSGSSSRVAAGPASLGVGDPRGDLEHRRQRWGCSARSRRRARTAAAPQADQRVHRAEAHERLRRREQVDEPVGDRLRPGGPRPIRPRRPAPPGAGRRAAAAPPSLRCPAG